MEEILRDLPEKAAEVKAETKKFFKKIKKKPPRHLDITVHELHEKEFKKTDCLACGNCCKTTSPIFTNADIARISKHFRMSIVKFTDTYLQMDEDDWWVLKSAPCTFLADDNSCNIYDVRPKACKEYPHTNRKKFEQLTDLTLQNVEVCPAAFNIVEEMKKRIKV